MWGKRKSSDDAAWQRAFKNRLEAVLGPHPPGPASEANPSDNHETAENAAQAGLAISIAIGSAPGDGPSGENLRPGDAHPHNGNGHIGPFSADTSSRRENGRSSAPPGEMLGTKLPESANGGPENRPAAGVARNGENEFADWRARCEEVLENQSKLFQERVARIAEEAFWQARANAQGIVSRLEVCLAQAENTKSGIEASLTDLSAKSRETADAQTCVLETALGTFTSQIAVLAGRVDEYRTQIDQMSSSLELTLTSISQRTQEALQVQAQAFGEEMDRIAQQALGQAEDHIDDRTAKLREAAAHSLEGHIAPLLERARNSQCQTETLLERMEGSRLRYGAEVENARRSLGELRQKEIESAVKILQGRAAKELESLTAKVSEEIRNRVRNEVAAATREFIEQQGRARIQEAFRECYEKCKQDLSSEKQLALDLLRTKSQELGAELVKQVQIRSRGSEESLPRITTVLDDALQTQSQPGVESAAESTTARQRKRRAGKGGKAPAGKKPRGGKRPEPRV